MIGMAGKVVQRKHSTVKYSDFWELSEQIDVLFFGSSHILNGINPLFLYEEYGITSSRGNWIEKRGIYYMPTWHPAALLRDENKKTDEYQKRVSILDKYLQYDEEGNKRVFVPNVSFHISGEIIGTGEGF